MLFYWDVPERDYKPQEKNLSCLWCNRDAETARTALLNIVAFLLFISTGLLKALHGVIK